MQFGSEFREKKNFIIIVLHVIINEKYNQLNVETNITQKIQRRENIEMA